MRGFAADPSCVLGGLWGGNLSVRRAHWLQALTEPSIGGAYHGDRELGLRFQEVGLRGVFDVHLRADHWYTRPASQLVDDARSSAVGQLCLHRAYPEAVDHPRQVQPAIRA